jgi:predicted AAA+ superfamily ATPase
MIARPRYEQRVLSALERSPVVTLLGPRQSGKTTLARGIWEKLGGTYLDLDLRSDQTRLSNPESFLGSLKGLVVLDEVQRDPTLLRLLRPLADRMDRPATFLLLGSASPEIVRNASETLAGRTEFVDLSGFDLAEVGSHEFERLWFRGGFPRSFLSDSDEASGSWLEGFTRTFLERDLPQLGYYTGAAVIRRLWTMIASVHGQPVNFSSLGRSMGLNYKTIQQYVDILEGAFMIRRLPPWFSNTRKRLVKSPKIFVRDSGVLHSLLQIDSLYELKGHAISGTSWEGFALEQFFSVFGHRNCYFWCTHQNAEIDLLAIRSGKYYGLEMKLAEAPGITRSMRIAIDELDLEHLWVIYPGSETLELDSAITACPLSEMPGLPI